ncbi:MAG: MAPEG family protein [Alphaproteobacteria bacterium]|nr:MAPEG family protein [Alphaproteobacteria bacterium]
MTAIAFPAITAATAVVLAVLQMFLLLYAARGRGQFRVGLGDGGSEPLLARIRMHGNLAENAPLFLILLMLTEMSGRWSGLVPIFALVFVLARFSHAVGLRMSAGVSVFRLFGVVGTVLTVLGLCVLLAIVLLHSN